MQGSDTIDGDDNCGQQGRQHFITINLNRSSRCISCINWYVATRISIVLYT